jgi:hypothetical protein
MIITMVSAMNEALFVVVLGALLLALAVDVGAVVGWLRMWRQT